MRSQWLPGARSETREPFAADGSNAGGSIRTAAEARPALVRTALLGGVWLGALAALGTQPAYAVDGTWTGPGAEWTTGTNWSSSPTVPDNTATFTNNAAPTSVTISSSTSINTIEFDAAAPAYSFTVQNGATFTINTGTANSSSFAPAFTINTGAALTVGDTASVEVGSLAGGGTVTIGPSDPSALLSITGTSSTTFSGAFAGAGSLELDSGALTLTGASNSGNIGTIGGDLSLCNCDSGGVTISGGSLTVQGLSTGVTVLGGTLAVINGGTLQIGPSSGGNSDLLVATNMLVTDAGSNVTVNGFTGIGIFGPGSLTISNGGALDSRGGAEIDDFPIFGGTPTVTVTGPGSIWTIRRFGLSVGGGSTGGPGILTVSNGGRVDANDVAIGDIPFGQPSDGTSLVTVTGPGSVLNVTMSLLIGDSSCGCNTIGTLTVADGGVVNSAGFTGIGAGSTLNLGIGGLAGAIVTPAIDNEGQIVANFTDTLTLAADISGAGSLSKAGAGTLVLTGNNSYSGGTSITGGLINFNSANSFGTGAITLDGGGLQWATGNSADISSQLAAFGAAGATFDTNGNNVTLASSLSGPGSLTKTGAGTMTLAGVNSYQGGTAVNAGTLAVAADNNLGNAAGGLSFNGGTLQFLSGFTTNRAVTLNAGGGTFDTDANNATLAGAIGGIGGLTKTGAGALTLASTSSYTGATAVNGGTLQAGAANAFAPLSAFTVAAGATLGLNSFNQTVGSLAGAGSVTLGAATLTTGNDNTSTTFSGVISGTGGLVKIGGGVLTLSGANTYSGGTTIAGGTISLANSQALGTGPLITTGSVVDYANGVTIANAIVLNSNTTQLQVITGTATQAGVISELNGPRPLEKIGAGALVLTAANTYTGPTTVSGGALVVTGSIAGSTVTVNAGALVAGTGTIGTTTILGGGALAPGSGTPGSSMTVAGNLAFQSGALYLVQVNPSAASSANVSGAASLAGTVAVSFSSGSFSRSYRILSATGGLGGTAFNAVTAANVPANFVPSLSYTANDVFLNLTAVLGTGAGLSENQRNVAGALNGFFNNGGALPPNFVSIFGLTGANLGNALSALSGEAAAGAQQAAFQMESQFLGLMLDPFVDGRSGIGGATGPALGFAPEREELPDDIALAYSSVLKAPPAKVPTFEQRWTAWGGAYGGGNRTSGDPAVLGSHDLSANTAGFAGGLDYHLSHDSVVGFALAGGGTNWSLSQGLGGGKSDAFQAGLYGATRWGAAYLAAAFAYTNHWMSTDRFAFAGDHLTASFNAQSFGGRVESGYRFATWYGGVTPYAAIQAQNFHTPSYAETDTNGGGFALAYNARTATDTRSELGARFDRLIAFYPGAALSLRARLAWAHDWVSDPSLAAVFQTLPGASFIVNGALPAKDSALASAGAEYRLASGVTLLAKFDGEFASHSSTYAGTGTIRYAW
jgi:outer membrane autotransporter protein